MLKKQNLKLFHLCICLNVLFNAYTVESQVNFTQSDLPLFVIKTNGQVIKNEPKIFCDLDVIYNGPGKKNSLTDKEKHYNGKIGIEYRGSSSQDLSPKKPIGFETRNIDGSNRNVSLLGMPSENDWILLAPYSDKSLMRDALIHQLARQMMPYSSQTRFVEVIINGEYQGVYVLMEKIKQDDGRVNIKPLFTNNNAGDALTGGYIIKIDKTSGSAAQGGFNSMIPSGQNKFTYYQYDYPGANIINAQQKEYIGSLVKSMESAFNASDWKDPITGFRKFVDEKSMIDFMLLNELANNVDGYRLSTYLYKDADSKNKYLKFGPIWDFNLGFGNANYCEGAATSGLALEFNNKCPNDNWVVPFYWGKVLSDATYYNNARTRWIEIRKNIIENNRVNYTIDSFTTLLSDASERNFKKWPVLSEWVWPNYYVGGSYAAEINYLKTWMKDRIKWLDGYFKYDSTVPVLQIPKNKDFVFFPNPTTNTLNMSINDYKLNDLQFKIYNTSGQRILLLKKLKSYTINTQSLPSGIYILQVYKGANLLHNTYFQKL